MSLSELRFSRDESSENQGNLNYDFLHNDHLIIVKCLFPLPRWQSPERIRFRVCGTKFVLFLVLFVVLVWSVIFGCARLVIAPAFGPPRLCSFVIAYQLLS